MTANFNPIFILTVKDYGQTFTSADTTSKKDIVSPGSNGTRIDSLMISTDDTTAVNLSFYINDGSTDYYVGVVAVAIGSGFTTVPRVEGMLTLAPLLGYLVIPSGGKLKASCVATMTGAKTTTVVAMGGDY